MSLLNADPKGSAFCVVIQGAERAACHPFRISRLAHRRLSAPDDRGFNRRGLLPATAKQRPEGKGVIPDGFQPQHHLTVADLGPERKGQLKIPLMSPLAKP
ncbi:hypothetical protein ACGYLI_09575 [Sulfitobacter sp. 1A13421]|uniref:hypothetical protein n=1 Tax=Sulfitobacter sp. 1A13421 TaxID=3368595 RepID=UPI003745CF02